MKRILDVVLVLVWTGLIAAFSYCSVRVFGELWVAADKREKGESVESRNSYVGQETPAQMPTVFIDGAFLDHDQLFACAYNGKTKQLICKHLRDFPEIQEQSEAAKEDGIEL